ncbi:maleylpyruvate isomerase N-terminal domain-containing protein [Paractinoplanes lichenicola]|uniref:Maleylpyruvate isomerase N-terminal domain-containing protein n=1 Tax=Paractinoplanes lichenicola TaxID=2802976 RepID=A0ABS1VTE3_9ACTN|nr:maleylpyruvate isomerase N-terminal domain-containing protein [Actinoplanes lichenicola]MBL7257730.1 maleylpyruvate isomerase N-terminal domain-containing protein [Actinoplanes lichenicola]
MDYRRTYRSAAVTFVDLVGRVPADRLDGPGLGDWSLRALIGHTLSSALVQVPTVLGTPTAPVNVAAPEGYFAFVRDVPAEVYAAALAASEVDAHDSAASIDDAGALAGRATQALAAVGDDDVVSTPVGGMRVRDWLPTRTFELVVHGTDVALAADVPVEFDPAAASEATLLAAKIAVALGDGPVVLRALTGRASLPGTFSVV